MPKKSTKKKPTNRASMLQNFVSEGVKIQREIKNATEVHVAPLREAMKDLVKAAEANGFQPKAVREMVREKLMEFDLLMEITAYREMINGDDEDDNPLD